MNNMGKENLQIICQNYSRNGCESRYEYFNPILSDTCEFIDMMKIPDKRFES